MLAAIIRTQRGFLEACEGAGHTIGLLVQSTLWLRAIPRKRKEILAHLFLSTFGSMPVVFIMALFTGMLVAYQSGITLQTYNQERNLGLVVAAAICREMGPIFTALPLAGLIGSTFAAEIATMKVSEEIDALEVMSIHPVYYLVMPRIVALTLACPLLTIYSDAIGILGGALVSKSIFRVDFSVYFNDARTILELKDIYGGLLKALVFGSTIAAIACSQGLRAENGAEGVGRATLRSVVLSMIFILVFSFFLATFIYR